MICIDFLLMAWLGVTRLSQIAPHLKPRDDIARAFGLPRFCDHTTAHNFLNAFHRPHLAQLDRVNARLLAEHGVAPNARAPILDLDVAARVVRRTGRRRKAEYRWAVAFSAGEAVGQALAHNERDWSSVVLRATAAAREHLASKPTLVRLGGHCPSLGLLAALHRLRLPFLSTVTWAWALAQRPGPAAGRDWSWLDPERRILDLGNAPAATASGVVLRTILVERAAALPGLPRERFAVVSSLADEAPAGIVRLAASQSTIRAFYGHARWPLGDGKMPSGDVRGVAAYLRLATIAMNVLRLFARHLGDEWTLPRLRDQLRLIDGSSRRGTGRVMSSTASG